MIVEEEERDKDDRFDNNDDNSVISRLMFYIRSYSLA